MTGTTTQDKTAADNELLAKVRGWARDNGWTDTNLGWVNPDKTIRVREAEHGVGIDIWWRTDAGNWQMFATHIPASTVRQAVDLLVAYDILPADFSSQYWEGYITGYENGVEARTDLLDAMAPAARLAVTR